MEQKKPKPRPRLRYGNSTDNVVINDGSPDVLSNKAQRLLPGVNELLHEIKHLKDQLSAVKEEKDDYKEEVTFLKYQLAYRAQVQSLQKEMSEKRQTEQQISKKQKSVRFSSSVSVDDGHEQEGEISDEDTGKDYKLSSNVDREEYNMLKAEKQELEDVLYDFYHDAKIANSKERLLVADIDSLPSESISSLICRVLVNYEKLHEEHRILEEEKLKLDEDKVQLCASMAKLRENFHDAVDSNIEEIEDLNRENEELRFKVKTLEEKDGKLRASFLQSRENTVSSLKSIIELTNSSTLEEVLEQLKRDVLQAENELKEAKDSAGKPDQEKGSKLKRVQSLPSPLRQETELTTGRGGLLRELKTCKDLQESQRKQIQKILEEKLVLEVQLSEIKRQNVLLKAERRVNIKTKSRLVQTENINKGFNERPPGSEDTRKSNDVMESLSLKCKDLERKLEETKREKSTAEEEKKSLLMSLDANIEKKDALEEQLNVLQAKLSDKLRQESSVVSTRAVLTQTDSSPIEKDEPSHSEADGIFNASYKKDISEVKVEIEKIRSQELDKQVTILKRENEAVKEKLKKAEDMAQTLQNCLKELTDEKYELLDSIEELNEEKAELEETRLKLEKELGGQEKFVVDEVSDIRNKERKLGNNIEASKAKLTQLDLKVAEVLSLIGNGDARTGRATIDSQEGVDDIIGSLLSTVENLKLTVSTFKTTCDKTKGDSLQMKDELQAISQEKDRLQIRVEGLEKKAKEMAVLLENKTKSQGSHEFTEGQQKESTLRSEKELEKMGEVKKALEKSLAEARKRDVELERQLKDVRGKRDGLQKAFDLLNRQCNETTLLLADTKKEVERSRSSNEQLTKEMEQLREDLEGTVEERDELLELLDRIVNENAKGEERQDVGLKVERIRERSRSEEALTDIGFLPGDPVNGKPVEENFLVSTQATVESSSLVENKLFITVPVGEVKTDPKSMAELLEENNELKEMVEKMINDQKRMELALSSFSEANAEIRQDLEDSIEQTEQIRVQGSEENLGNDIVDYGADYQQKDDDNANVELRRLHEVMVGTNQALEANLRRLQEEKVRAELLKNSWQEISRKNEALERNVETLTNNKVRIEQKLSTLEVKRTELEKKVETALKERQDLKKLLKKADERVRDLNSQVESLTETNKSLMESNERFNDTSKETEKKWSKLNDEFDELEFKNEELERVNKRFQQQLNELTQQKSAVDLELEQSREMIVSLSNEVASHSKRSRELQCNLDTNEKEFKTLRETASKFSLLQEKADGVDVLKSEIETLKQTIVEREQLAGDLEDTVSRLNKEIENLQRSVKDSSQENDNLRVSLSKWEREVSKLRQRVRQVSQGVDHRKETIERSSSAKKELHPQVIDETRKFEKAFEAMQVEMEAINKHLKSLTNENKELNCSVEKLSKENNEVKDRNIQLLTRYDMVSKELESKVIEINKMNKNLKKVGERAQTNIESRDKLERENSVLQTSCEKLERENAILKNSLASTLNEEKVLGKRLKSLVEATSPIFHQPQDWVNKESEDLVSRPRKISNDEWSMGSETEGLNATKPDLIRHSKDAKDESIVSGQGKFNDKYFMLGNGGVGKDAQEIVKGILKERVSLNRHFQELEQIFQKIKAWDNDSRRELEEALKVREKMKVSLEITKASLEKANRDKAELENEVEEKRTELTKVTDEKNKLERNGAVVKEKSDKLQAVFRALIQVMNDKKGKIGGEKVGRQSDESEGSKTLIDYIKNIKTKYTGLVTENEKLEEKVNSLQGEIDDYRTKQKLAEDVKAPKNEDFSKTKATLEDKERILKELLLTSARDKRRFVEKLQELHDELSRVKTQLGEEIGKQRTASPTSVLILERVYQEFVESVTHTETFIQSVVHERRATVVAGSSSEKDPNLELAKENEELIGRINAIQSSRRREMKSMKEELSKISKEKEDTIRTTESKWQNEVETMKGHHEKSLKEKEQLLSNIEHSWKEEVDQLKQEIRRISDENEKAQRTTEKETRLLVEKLENQNKLLKEEVDKVVTEKRKNDARMAEMKREALTEAKEKQRLADSEIQHLRANWVDTERKLRIADEEKQDIIRKLGQVDLEKIEQEKKAGWEMQRLRAAVEYANKQTAEREDVFKRERERLQGMISVLNDTMQRTEVTGLERTQTKISEFQQALEELAKQNKQLENAKLHSEQSRDAELEKLRRENAKLQQELWESHEQRRVAVNSKEQSRITEPSSVAPVSGRVKVLGSTKQPPVDKPMLITPLESIPASVPGPGESQRRVMVREGQTAVIHKGRVQGQGMLRTSEHRDPVFEELGTIFQQLNDGPEWMDDARRTASVIQAKPIQIRGFGTSNESQLQMPQPEWETERQDNVRPYQEDSYRNVQVSSRQQKSPLTTASSRPNGQIFPSGMAHVKDDKRPSSQKTKPIAKQTSNSTDTTKLKKSSVENLERHPVEVKKLPTGRSAQSVKSSRPRRPSIGSDDVFLSGSAEASPTLASYGSKQSDFEQSQSLTDLTDTSEDKKKAKPPGQHTSRKHKLKLPKSFSGPRKGEPAKQGKVQAGRSASPRQQEKSDKDSKAKKILPLKGMEYVIFQHQI